MRLPKICVNKWMFTETLPHRYRQHSSSPQPRITNNYTVLALLFLRSLHVDFSFLVLWLQVFWLKTHKFGGWMVWSLDMDDFSGKFCKKGKFPLLTAMNRMLLSWTRYLFSQSVVLTQRHFARNTFVVHKRMKRFNMPPWYSSKAVCGKWIWILLFV